MLCLQAPADRRASSGHTDCLGELEESRKEIPTWNLSSTGVKYTMTVVNSPITKFRSKRDPVTNSHLSAF